jgi:hypothetical protein
MGTRFSSRAQRRNAWAARWASLLFIGASLSGGACGVTVITHGFNGNVTDWVLPMANKIPAYRSFFGSNCVIYQISITQGTQGYTLTPSVVSGGSPLSSDSGEIVVALDWSTLSGFGPSTSTMAAQAATALLSTNLFAGLGGHTLVEQPLHLVGHSRGASLMAELARILGAQGLWVDQLTSLDPYPLSLDSDPGMKLYANILYVDNYWQNTDFPSGQSLTGAYNRYLSNLSGGYPAGSAHSDVHLWYHGTVDWNTPTGDNLATITSAERSAWWTATEAAGTNTGFLYSLIGGGNRLSSLEPAGSGNGRVSDGFNRQWDLGAGAGTNRSALPTNNGAWPNLIRLNLASTNVAAGDPVSLSFYYQFGAGTGTTATAHFFLGASPNPYRTNGVELAALTLAGTGTTNVGFRSASFVTDPTTVLPGTYFVWAQLADGAHTRYLGAPQRLVVTPSRQVPVLAAGQAQAGGFTFTVTGYPSQSVVVEASSDLRGWLPLQTNALTSSPVTVTDPGAAVLPLRFYRARLTH